MGADPQVPLLTRATWSRVPALDTPSTAAWETQDGIVVWFPKALVPAGRAVTVERGWWWREGGEARDAK